MTTTNYPIVTSPEQLVQFAQEITRLRELEDIPDFTNLNQIYVLGRVTSRIPSSPSDVTGVDNIGDIVTDAAGGFEYKLVDNAGTLVWDRRALNISW